MEFVRGDTFAFKVKLKRTDQTVIKKDDLKSLYVTVRKSVFSASPVLFQKTIEDVEIDDEGYCHIKIEPTDTEKLNYGVYFFDIELTTIDNYRKSKLFQLKLTEETTMHESGDKVGA